MFSVRSGFKRPASPSGDQHSSSKRSRTSGLPGMKFVHFNSVRGERRDTESQFGRDFFPDSLLPGSTFSTFESTTTRVSSQSCQCTFEAELGPLVWRVADIGSPVYVPAPWKRHSVLSGRRDSRSNEVQEPMTDPSDQVGNGNTTSSAQETLVHAASIAVSRNEPWTTEIYDILRNVFQLPAFRSGQEDVINATMKGQDVFGILPTGGGKSLCYQLPVLCSGGKTAGVTVVISPLRALIADQEEHLVKVGIMVVSMLGDMNEDRRKEGLLRNAGTLNRPALLYITPEKLELSTQTGGLLDHLHKQERLVRFVVDEAHSASKKSRSRFRTSYNNLRCLRKCYPEIPIMALSASVTLDVLNDVTELLNMAGCEIVRRSADRPNLRYEVRNKHDGLKELHDYIRSSRLGESGLIFCSTKKDCEKVAESLSSSGVSARYYHAGRSDPERRRIERDWKDNKFDIVVATIAFGMGIDKPDVRFVIHYSLPSSMEEYYQQTSRAGRDGERAFCVLYFSFKDWDTKKKAILNEAEKNCEERLQDLIAVVRFCLNLTECRRAQLLRHFDEEVPQPHCQDMCDNCEYSSLLTEENTSEDASLALLLVREVQRRDRFPRQITITQALSVLTGASTHETRVKGWETLFAHKKISTDKKELYRNLFYRLILCGAIREMPKKNGDHYCHYMTSLEELGTKILDNNEPFMVHRFRSTVSPTEQTRRKRGRPRGSTSKRNKSQRPQGIPKETDARQFWQDQASSAKGRPSTADKGRNSRPEPTKQSLKAANTIRRPERESRVKSRPIISDSGPDTPNTALPITTTKGKTRRSPTIVISSDEDTDSDHGYLEDEADEGADKAAPISVHPQAQRRDNTRRSPTIVISSDEDAESDQRYLEDEPDDTERPQPFLRRTEPYARARQSFARGAGNKEPKRAATERSDETDASEQDIEMDDEEHEGTELARVMLRAMQSALHDIGPSGFTLHQAQCILKGTVRHDRGNGQSRWTKLKSFGACMRFPRRRIQQVLICLDETGAFSKEYVPRGLALYLSIVALSSTGVQILKGKKKVVFPAKKAATASKGRRSNMGVVRNERRRRTPVEDDDEDVDMDATEFESSDDEYLEYDEPTRRPAARDMPGAGGPRARDNEDGSDDSQPIAGRTRSQHFVKKAPGYLPTLTKLRNLGRACVAAAPRVQRWGPMQSDRGRPRCAPAESGSHKSKEKGTVANPYSLLSTNGDNGNNDAWYDERNDDREAISSVTRNKAKKGTPENPIYVPSSDEEEDLFDDDDDDDDDGREDDLDYNPQSRNRTKRNRKRN